MYFAAYETPYGRFTCGALQVADTRRPGGLPEAWIELLLRHPEVDFAVRAAIGPDCCSQTVILSDADKAEKALEPLLVQLHDTGRSASAQVRVPDSPDSFDDMVGDIPEYRLWLSHRGYRAGPHTVASDFRFLPLVAPLMAVARDRRESFAYQINFRSHRSTREDQREVRKFIAAQRIESSHPEPMRDLQITMASRLLESGYLIEEFFAVGPLILEEVRLSIDRQFEATMGGFGFSSPPVESSGFDELLLTGRHSTRFVPDTHFLIRAASCLRPIEAEQIIRSGLRLEPAPAVSRDRTGAPEAAFISYSSNDFARAIEICRHLESLGIACWIAPRDIPAGAPYPDSIIRGIDRAKAVVVVLSESSNLSPHVHREIERALHRNALIIPLRIQEIRASGSMEYLLGTLQRIDAAGSHFPAALDELSARLRSLIAEDKGPDGS